MGKSIEDSDALKRIEAIDWAALHSALGDASTVPIAARQLLLARTETEASAAYWRLDNVIVVQGSLFSAALPLIAPLLDSLELALSRHARHRVVELLTEIALGGPDPSEIARGNDALADDCRRALRTRVTDVMTVLDDPDPLNRLAALSLLDRIGMDRGSLERTAARIARSDADARVRARANAVAKGH